MKLSRIAALVLAAAVVACSTVQIDTDYDTGANFSSYKTFAFKPGAPPQNPLAAERMRNAIAGALSARGLTRAETGADLNVFLHFKLGKETQLITTGYGIGGWGRGGGMATTTVQEFPTGTLVVDLVDTKENKLVWRGVAKDYVSASSRPEVREEQANEVARKLFEDFPPRR